MSHTAAADPIRKSPNEHLKAPMGFKPFFSILSGTAPGFAARLASDLFCKPRHGKPRSAEEMRWLAGGAPFAITYKGQKLAAWSWGDGPTVLLQHGWAGRGSQLGAFVEPLVKAGYSVIAYDAPAHGYSPGRGTTGFEMADIIAQIAERNLSLHAIVAHSIGCSAAALAMSKGIRVERAVFVNPAPLFAGILSQYSEAIGLTEHVVDLMTSKWEARRDEKVREFGALSYAADQSAPLLVISDEEDREVDWREGQRIADAWPGARFERTKGYGHSRILGEARAVEQVVGFLTRSAESVSRDTDFELIKS